MKKTICMLLTIILALALAGCGAGAGGGTGDTDKADIGRQTASAYLDQDGTCIEVTADLTGGWSVEFARGAAYLYDGEITEDKESTAMLITLDKDVYEEDMDEAMADDNHKEADGGVYYTGSGNEGSYLTSLNDSAYVLITAPDQASMEDIVARFTLALD